MIFPMWKIMLAFFVVASSPALAAERRFTVTDFDKVQVDGPFEVILTTGKAASAMASGDLQALDRVSVETIGRTLRVKPNRSAWGGYPGEGPGPVRITLSAHEIRSATVTGPGKLSIDRVKAMRVDLGLSGSGSISVTRLEADVAGVDLIGSGTIEIGGAVKSLRVTVQGSGDLNAQRLTVQDAQIFSETSGTVDLIVKNSAKLRSAGSGDIFVAGTPACTVEAIGSGRVVCGSC